MFTRALCLHLLFSLHIKNTEFETLEKQLVKWVDIDAVVDMYICGMIFGNSALCPYLLHM